MSEATPVLAPEAVCCCGCGLSGGEFALPPPVGSWATSTVLNDRKAKTAKNRFRRVGRATLAVPLLSRGPACKAVGIDTGGLYRTILCPASNHFAKYGYAASQGFGSN